MTTRTHRWISWAGLVILLALHLDFWRPPSDRLLFDWLPVELAWRLGWMALAWGYMLHFCSAIWREKGP